MSNWRCRLFGHKLRDLSGEYPDGTSIRNVGECRRCGQLRVLRLWAPYRYAGPDRSRAK